MMYQTLLTMLMQLALASLVHAAPVAIQSDAWQYGTGGGIVGFIVFILDVIAIVEVVKSNRPLSHKIIWSLLIFLFPIIGIIVYYLLSDRNAHKSGYEVIP